jgi:drug/metabolite transporter (DMT)-like permease
MHGPFYAILFALLLGGASIFSRRGLEIESYRVLLVISLAIGAPLFLILAALTTGFAETPFWGVVYAAIAAVLATVLGRSLYFIGIKYLGPGKSLSVTATSPMYAAILALVILGETITPWVVIGTLGIVLGIITISKDVRQETETESYSIAVILYPLTGAVIAAIAVTIRKMALNTGLIPIEAAAINMVVGLLVVTPLIGTRWREELINVNRSALWNFGIAGIIMAIGLIFYFMGLRETNTSIFFPLAQTQPLFAVIFSAIFLSRLEVITRWSLIGSSIIVAGSTMIILG